MDWWDWVRRFAFATTGAVIGALIALAYLAITK